MKGVIEVLNNRHFEKIKDCYLELKSFFKISYENYFFLKKISY
jgi:hypothetical protein